MSKIFNTPELPKYLWYKFNLCVFTHAFGVMEASSYTYFATEELFLFWSGCIAINLPQSNQTQHIFDYMDVICAWNWRTSSEMKSLQLAWQSHKISELWCWWFLYSTRKLSSWVKLTPHGVMRVNTSAYASHKIAEDIFQFLCRPWYNLSSV